MLNLSLRLMGARRIRETVLRAIATGTRQVGQTLTAALSDGSDLTGASYQWYRDGVAITDETTQIYTIVGADDGVEISVEITKDATTYLSAGVVVSYPVATATGLTPVTITEGSATPIDASSGFTGASGGAYSISGGGSINSSTGVIDVSGVAVGSNTLIVTYTNSGGAASFDLDLTVDAITVSVSYDNLEVGGTFTATSNIAEAAVSIFLLETDEVGIGTGSASYVIQTSDISKYLTAYASFNGSTATSDDYAVEGDPLYETWTDAGDGTYYIDTNKTSVTLTVDAPPESVGSYTIDVSLLASGPLNLKLPEVTGAAAQGSTLSLTYDGLYVNDFEAGVPTFAYRWQENGVDISDETATDYVSTSGNAGNAIRLAVDATDLNGTKTVYSNEIVVAGGASAFAKTDDDSLTALLQTDTEHTLSAAAIGAADTNRKVVVGLMGSRTAGTATITGVTIGGVTAAKVTGISSTRCLTEWWQAPVPTGTTGDIVVTFGASAGVQGLRGIVYRSVGKTITAGVTNFVSAVSASVDTSVVNGETLLGIAVGRNSGTMTWTGLTREGTDFDLGGDDYCSAGIQAITTTETRTVTMTTDTSTNVAASTLRIQ